MCRARPVAWRWGSFIQRDGQRINEVQGRCTDYDRCVRACQLEQTTEHQVTRAARARFEIDTVGRRRFRGQHVADVLRRDPANSCGSDSEMVNARKSPLGGASTTQSPKRTGFTTENAHTTLSTSTHHFESIGPLACIDIASCCCVRSAVLLSLMPAIQTADF